MQGGSVREQFGEHFGEQSGGERVGPGAEQGAPRPGGTVGIERGGEASVHIERIECGLRLVLAVRGEVDIATVDELVRALEHAVAAPHAEVVVDVTTLDFLGVVGVHALRAARAQVQIGGRDLRILATPWQSSRLFGPMEVAADVATRADRATLWRRSA